MESICEYQRTNIRTKMSKGTKGYSWAFISIVKSSAEKFNPLPGSIQKQSHAELSAFCHTQLSTFENSTTIKIKMENLLQYNLQKPSWEIQKSCKSNVNDGYICNYIMEARLDVVYVETKIVPKAQGKSALPTFNDRKSMISEMQKWKLVLGTRG